MPKPATIINDQRRTYQIPVRVTLGERERIKEAAYRQRKSLNGFCLEVMLAATEAVLGPQLPEHEQAEPGRDVA